MRFSIGAEMDNDPRARPDAQNIIDAMRPDGIIRSVHFVPIQHPEKGADWLWPFDNEEFAASPRRRRGTDQLWELYIAKLLDDLEKLPAHIVGHFYAPATFGRWPAQKSSKSTRIGCSRSPIVAAWPSRSTRASSTASTRGSEEKSISTPTRGSFARLRARGVGIAVGSDAHSPKDQGNGFDVVLKLLDDAKINEVVFPVGGRLARVALRATREHLEAQAQARRQPITPGSSITGYSRAELGLPEACRGCRRTARGAHDARHGTEETRGRVSSTPSTSRRSAESSSSASKAKAARVGKPATRQERRSHQAVTSGRKKRAVGRRLRRSQRSGRAKTGSRRAAKKTSPVRTGARKKSAGKPASAQERPARKTPAKKAAAKKPAARRPAKPKPKRASDRLREEDREKEESAAKAPLSIRISREDIGIGGYRAP